MSSIFFLIYHSFAGARFGQAELTRLLEVSRQNNARAGVTGMLLYRDGRFLQYLEGEQEAVERLFEKIELDRRHHSTRIIFSGNIKARMFPDWSMGFRTLAGLRADNTEGYSECLQPGFQPLGKADYPVERLTRLFYDERFWPSAD